MGFGSMQTARRRGRGLPRLYAQVTALWTVGLLCIGLGNAGEPRQVDLQLVLAADVSGSMSPAERQLQRDGYAEALKQAGVANAVRSGALGKIALTYLEWAGPTNHAVVVPWTIVDGPATLADFSRRILSGPHVTRIGSTTGLSDALLLAERQFRVSDIISFRKIVDISGDGRNNDGPSIAMTRDRVVAHGVTINALSIALPDDAWRGQYDFSPDGEPIHQYYQRNVVGGPGSFAMVVDDMGDFVTMLERKLIVEISSLEGAGCNHDGAGPDAVRHSSDRGCPVDCAAGPAQPRRGSEARG